LLANAFNQQDLTDADATRGVQNDAWQILDTEEQWQKFSQPFKSNPSSLASSTQEVAENTLIQSHLLVDGLRCAACSGIIEHGLQQLPGVVSARVSMSKKRAVVVWSPATTRPSLILKTIQNLGYSANPASNIEHQRQDIEKSRAAFWRWLVAGFCMMQVMMYASPSYFTALGEISDDIRHLLNWASWLLSLPVLLFSSSSFFSSAFRDLKSRQVSMDLPVALGIAITFIVSSAATFDPSGWWGNTIYFDSLTMFVFFLLSARLIEVKLHSKTMGALEALVSRIPESTSRLNLDGSFTRVLNSQLKIGDIVRVNIGEAFPADGEIVLGETRVDESLLTGESTPIQKDSNSKVIAGSYNLGQAVHVTVDSLGESTQYGQIVNLINQAAIEKPRLSQLVDRIAKPFLLFVICSAALAAALLWQEDHGRALMTAAAVLIVTCPCALSLATPAAMLASASAFVKRGILIKHLQAIESIANIDTIIFDKTGTLTDDHIMVANVQCKAGLSEQTALLLAAALAKHSMHPISRAIVSAQGSEKSTDITPLNLTGINEVVGAGIQAELKSVLAHVQPGTIRLGSAQFCATKVTDALKQQVYLADSTGWLATFDLQERLKPQAKEAVSALKAQHFHVELLSGDQSNTVLQIAENVGITTFQAACRPQDKLKRLHALKQEGRTILMVGDGLNDGPILASAHVSIAMGKGVPLTQAHADYILLNGDISQIPALIAHAKKTMRIIKQNIIWAIVYNLVCIPLAFFGVLSAWLAGLGMAVSSLIVVTNALRLTSFTSRSIEDATP
jgi:Cu2+-exporting ATPase